MRRADLIGGAGLFVLGLVMILVVIPSGTTAGLWHGLSPYFYPTVMVSGIMICAVLLEIQAFRRPDLYEDQPPPIGRRQLMNFLLASLIILAGVLVIDAFGIWIGGPLLIAGIMLFMGETSLVRIVPTAFLPVAVVHAIVTWILKSPLP
jgi:hypothetical protein